MSHNGMSLNCTASLNGMWYRTARYKSEQSYNGKCYKTVKKYCQNHCTPVIRLFFSFALCGIHYLSKFALNCSCLFKFSCLQEAWLLEENPNSAWSPWTSIQRWWGRRVSPTTARRASTPPGLLVSQAIPASSLVFCSTLVSRLLVWAGSERGLHGYGCSYIKNKVSDTSGTSAKWISTCSEPIWKHDPC